MVIGGCFVAMGTKSYFYRDGRRVSNGVVYNNDSNVLTVRDEEEAYDKIAEELGVKTLKLGYMPEGMYFENLVIEDGYGRLQYNCKTSRVFFVQTKSDKKTSRIQASDAKENHKIWNSILHMDIDVYMENIETGGTGYMAQFIYNGVCYYLSGAIEQNDFDEMLKKIHF